MSDLGGSKRGFPEIPGYRVERFIGRGAQGTVWLAVTADELERRAAIKHFPPVRRETYERELETFQRIERVRQETECEHLVEGYAAGRLPDGGAYIAMVYCEGGTLHDLMEREGPLAEREAVKHAASALRALEVLHQRGLFHKDVKPSNLLLCGDGHAKLSDFGLSHRLGQSVTAGGTLGFCAPELIRRERRVDGVLIDVYSTAATLYFLLTGRPPLPGQPDLFELIKAGCSPALQDCLVRGLSVNPRKRYRSTKLFREAIEGAATSTGAKRRKRTARSQLRRLAVLLGVCGVVGAALWSWPSDPKIRPDPAGYLTYSLDPGVGLVFRDAEGHERIDALDGIPVGAELDHDARGGLVAVTVKGDRKDSRLFVFDRSKGRRLKGWEEPFRLSEAAPSTWRPLDPYDAEARSFGLRIPRVADIDGDGEVEILVIATGIWATCGLVRVNLDRTVGGSFFQYGMLHVRQLVDVDGDGKLEALCGGVNNHVWFRNRVAFGPENPPVIFVLGPEVLARRGPRVLGPPGLPNQNGASDIEGLHSYHLLERFPVRGEQQLAWFLPDPTFSWQTGERRFMLQTHPIRLPGLTFRTFLDARGRFMRSEPAYPKLLEAEGVGTPPPPIALVLNGERQPLPEGWRLEEDTSHGVPFYRLVER